jgi:membrane protease YdiL (CAAX protease family)
MSSAQENSSPPEAPYWSYGDLGAFLVALAVLTMGLHLLARFQLLSRSQLSHPGDGLQIFIVLYLMLSLYAILKLRYRRAVVMPLGWVSPTLLHGIGSLLVGLLLGFGMTMYQRSQLADVGINPSLQLVLLASLLAPVLEESLFRGCLFPLLASKLGNCLAVAITAGVFALFHGPTDLVHWISFGLTEMAYVSLRVISGTTAAPEMEHSAYILVLLSATLR